MIFEIRVATQQLFQVDYVRVDLATTQARSSCSKMSQSVGSLALSDSVVTDRDGQDILLRKWVLI